MTEEKGLEKKRVIESEGSGLKEAGGLGGAQPPPEARRDAKGVDSPQKQDVTEEKGLEKKRGIEGEGSGLKEAGGLGGRSEEGP